MSDNEKWGSGPSVKDILALQKLLKKNEKSDEKDDTNKPQKS